jgi:hypothetical protein
MISRPANLNAGAPPGQPQAGQSGGGMMMSPMMTPPVFQPPVMQPPVMQPPMMQPPMMTPPVMQPPMVQAPMMQPPMVQAPMMQAPAMQAPQPSKGFPWLIVAIAFLAGILVVGIIVAIFMSKSDKKPDTPPAKQSYFIRQRATTKVISSC